MPGSTLGLTWGVENEIQLVTSCHRNWAEKLLPNEPLGSYVDKRQKTKTKVGCDQRIAVQLVKELAERSV